MTGIVRGDKTIVQSSLHREKPLPFRWDVFPFAVIYAALAYVYLSYHVPAPEEEAVSEAATATATAAVAAAVTDAVNATVTAAAAVAAVPTVPFVAGPDFYALIAFPVVIALHVLTALMQLWSVGFRAFVRYDNVPVSRMAAASTVCMVPDAHCGSAGLVPLRRTKDSFYFVFHSTKYTYKTVDQLKADAAEIDALIAGDGTAAAASSGVDLKSPAAAGDSKSNSKSASPIGEAGFYPLEFPIDLPLRHYQRATGSLSDAQTIADHAKYGDNIFDIPMPTFNELFREHATAPFFVFQMFCVALWCLDEYWYYSIMTLVMLVIFEATVVKRRMRNLEDLREMRVPAYPINVFRAKRWVTIKTTQLLPGDVCSIVRSDVADRVVPCDMLLLGGSAVVNEALLTGESVPQLKESIDNGEASERLDMNKEHRRHLIFGGTKILLQTPPSRTGGGPPSTSDVRSPPDHGCPAYVLRTGFNTNQGKLIRTILFGTERVSINNRESLYFILFLLIFAVAAAGYVLHRGLQDETRSRYKLLLNCIMIVTSVVPPELPMELSLAVNNSLLALMKEHIYCTEPFRIPLAGAVDVCCFDKTGTLTSDDFLVTGVAGLGGGAVGSITAADQLPDDTKFVIAGCHSLAFIGNGLVGDPLEKASFKAINFAYTKENVAISRPVPKHQIRIFHRFPFSSTLKRMTCLVVLAHESQPTLRVVSKGAAEVMESKFAVLPAGYSETYRYWSRQGCRVLALGYKHLPGDGGPENQLRHKSNATIARRDEVESGLTFAGFLILSCPLKPDAAHSIAHLAQANHQLMMITGDHVLTACSVASQLTIATRTVLILSLDSKATAGVAWKSVDDTVTRPFEGWTDERSIDALNAEYDLCMSGDAMEHILSRGIVTPAQLGGLVKYICVFARTSPDMKEFVLKWLKRGGLTTLMCGDGTNDVGALKQAHVGVALIGHEAPEIANIYANLGAGKSNGNTAAATAAAQKEAEAEADGDAGTDLSAGTAPAQRRGVKAGRPVQPAAVTGARKPPPKKLSAAVGAAGASAGAAGAGTVVVTNSAGQKRVLTLRDQINAAVRKMEQETKDEDRIIRLGDASIASPFTSKIPYIASTISIIRQGRCTLVTTLQMFQILALNCLVSAYSMSVLYLDGFKSGDTQMTLVGLSIAMFFLLISWSKPVEELSPQRPHSKLFTLHMFLAVMGQFALHMFVLLTAVSWANPYVPYDKENRDPEGDFKPNVLNTVCFLVSTSMTVATFLCNYQGRPFMASLRENKPLCYGLFGLDAFLFILATDTIQPLNEFMQLAPLPSVEFAWSLVGLMAFDLISTVAYSAIIKSVFAIKPKPHARRILTAGTSASAAAAVAVASVSSAIDSKA